MFAQAIIKLLRKGFSFSVTIYCIKKIVQVMRLVVCYLCSANKGASLWWILRSIHNNSDIKIGTFAQSSRPTTRIHIQTICHWLFHFMLSQNNVEKSTIHINSIWAVTEWQTSVQLHYAHALYLKLFGWVCLISSPCYEHVQVRSDRSEHSQSHVISYQPRLLPSKVDSWCL